MLAAYATEAAARIPATPATPAIPVLALLPAFLEGAFSSSFSAGFSSLAFLSSGVSLIKSLISPVVWSNSLIRASVSSSSAAYAVAMKATRVFIFLEKS